MHIRSHYIRYRDIYETREAMADRCAITEEEGSHNLRNAHAQSAQKPGSVVSTSFTFAAARQRSRALRATASARRADGMEQGGVEPSPADAPPATSCASSKPPRGLRFWQVALAIGACLACSVAILQTMQLDARCVCHLHAEYSELLCYHR